MERDYWLNKWQVNQIGFHRESANPLLLEYWHTLNPDGGTKVLVPLCGKTNDMVWLKSIGHRVSGVELSRIAVESFFSENALLPSVIFENSHEKWSVEGIDVWCGDLFDTPENVISDADLVYDRGALIALPPMMRQMYVDYLARLLHQGVQILLITFEYPQDEMKGPPFSVTYDELVGLYGQWCDIESLFEQDVLDDEFRFKERGLSALTEKVYKLTVR